MMLAQAHEAVQATAGMSGSIHIALAAFGSAIGVGMIASKAAESIGRNPGAFGNIFTVSILGMAFAEGLAILVFFVIGK